MGINIFCVLFACLSSFAAGTSDSKVQGREFRSGGGAADMLNMTKTPAALLQSQEKPMKVAFSCTSGTGQSFQKGDAGYYECMEQYQQSKKHPAAGRAPNQAAGFNINVD